MPSASTPSTVLAIQSNPTPTISPASLTAFSNTRSIAVSVALRICPAASSDVPSDATRCLCTTNTSVSSTLRACASKSPPLTAELPTSTAKTYGGS